MFWTSEEATGGHSHKLCVHKSFYRQTSKLKELVDNFEFSLVCVEGCTQANFVLVKAFKGTSWGHLR